MTKEHWYHDNAQVEDVIQAVVNEHLGATYSEIIAYTKEKGIPRYYVRCCLKYSVEFLKVRDKARAIHYYARDHEEVEAEIQRTEAEWLAKQNREGRVEVVMLTEAEAD